MGVDENADFSQADVIRNGRGNVYMGLSRDDSDTLWQAVQDRKFFFPCFDRLAPSSNLLEAKKKDFY